MNRAMEAPKGKEGDREYLPLTLFEAYRTARMRAWRTMCQIKGSRFNGAARKSAI